MSQIKDRAVRYRDKLIGIKHDLKVIKDELGSLSQRQTAAESVLRVIARDAATAKVQTLPISENEVLTKIFTDLKMYLDPRDISVAAHIALDGIWEKEITRAWLAVLKPEYTVLDIGANFGYFSLLSGQFTNKKKAKIVAFEANKNITPYLSKSVSINWLNEQMTVENLAVSDAEGEVTLNILENYIGSSSVQSLEHLDAYMHEKMKLKIHESARVKSVTIDGYCKKNSINEINLIKMDIEGHEEKAYSGMRGMVKKSKDVTLFIEFTKDGYEKPKEFYELMLKDFGHVYTINAEGQLVKVENNTYESVIGKADDWVMPVFSKNPQLDKLKSII